MDLSNATVGQVMIPVDDFAAGTAFYRDVLGLPFVFSAPPQNQLALMAESPIGHA